MRLLITFLVIPTFCSADVLLASRTIRAREVLNADHVVVSAGEQQGVFSEPRQVIGKESLRILYAGQPIGFNDVGPAALVERNQLVSITYEVGGLSISSEGRSLGRASAGDTVRVMNMSSRTTVVGIVQADGTVSLSE